MSTAAHRGHGLLLTHCSVSHRLKAYEQQLAQVQGALATDKGNEELANLEAELKNLISLTKQLLGAGQASTSSSSTSSAPAASTGARRIARQEEPSRGSPDVIRYAAGDECQAKYAVSRGGQSGKLASMIERYSLAPTFPLAITGRWQVVCGPHCLGRWLLV